MSVLAALLLAAAQAGVQPLPAAGGAVRARLAVRPAEVEVGEPFELVVEVEHPRGHVPTLPGMPRAAAPVAPVAPETQAKRPAGAPEPAAAATPAGEDALLPGDGSWVLLGSRLEPAVSLDGDPRRSVTRRVFELASLEPGERVLPAELVAAVLPEGTGAAGEDSGDAGDAGDAVDAVEQPGDAAPRIVVRGVLAEGEDAPRPLRGLPEGFGSPALATATSRWPWIAGGLALAAVLALAVARLLRRRAWGSRAAATPDDPGELLERLAADLPRDPALLRERHFALTRLLRESADRRAGAARAGLTDEEWLARLGEDALAPEARAPLAEVLGRAAAVKYGAALPTEWALRETVETARRALAALDGRRPELAAESGGGGA